MTVESSPGELLLTERTDEEPFQVPFATGELVAFSTVAPHKDRNEDSAVVLAYSFGGLLAVADGMGGQNAGHRASRAAVETLRDRLAGRGDSDEPLRHAVLDAFEAANRAVLDLGVGAGTTLAAVVLRDGHARTIHAGDSLVLHVGQRGRIHGQTIPHSPTGYAVEAGVLAEGDALHHEERHLVSNYVGQVGMRVDVGGAIPVAPRDTLLVASDGLADNLTLDEIVQRIRKGPLLEAARSLVKLARERMREPKPPAPSKPDDLTVLLYRPGAPPSAKSPARTPTN